MTSASTLRPGCVSQCLARAAFIASKTALRASGGIAQIAIDVTGRPAAVIWVCPVLAQMQAPQPPQRRG